jgi:hypothetical protein
LAQIQPLDPHHRRTTGVAGGANGLYCFGGGHGVLQMQLERIRGGPGVVGAMAVDWE